MPVTAPAVGARDRGRRRGVVHDDRLRDRVGDVAGDVGYARHEPVRAIGWLTRPRDGVVGPGGARTEDRGRNAGRAGTPEIRDGRDAAHRVGRARGEHLPVAHHGGERDERRAGGRRRVDRHGRARRTLGPEPVQAVRGGHGVAPAPVRDAGVAASGTGDHSRAAAADGTGRARREVVGAYDVPADRRAARVGRRQPGERDGRGVPGVRHHRVRARRAGGVPDRPRRRRRSTYAMRRTRRSSRARARRRRRPGVRR